ncbi:MAG: T9SS type A sorting domain-containing protein [Bacteroidota bacterium]
MKKFLLIFLFLCSVRVSAQPKAFPGAEGFGANVTGGRGGRVIYVTNLNDSGPGSLQEALNAEGKRTILFKVSGRINRTAEILWGDVTIAGQTSPGGIIVRGLEADDMYNDEGKSDNIIIRHIRSRPQTQGAYPMDMNYLSPDALRLDGASNVIVDHCSFANATDECVQISNARNITIQNCMLAETIGEHYDLGGMLLNYSSADHPQDSISIHHNIWNRIGGRFPELSCESPYCGERPLNIELSNNLIWDQNINIWYNSSINPGEENNTFFLNLNWVNNRSVVRSGYGNGMMDANLLRFEKNSIFADGNTMSKYPAYSDYQLFYCCNDFPDNAPNTDLGVAGRRTSRHNFPNITYTPNEELQQYMTENVGAFHRDSMDRRLLKALANNAIEEIPLHIAGAEDAFITENTQTAPTDTDSDGMPDYWEIANGLNPAQENNNNTDLSQKYTGVDGYTNLECYLNALSDSLITGKQTFVTGIENENTLLKEFSVYPNPMNLSATISYSTHAGNVEMSIINTLGENVMTFLKTHADSGNYTIQFPTEFLPAGIYTVLFKNGDSFKTRSISIVH